ncbi:Frag1/DRAM/Sfk1 [Aphelenchoides avenae]|nr:Frag1/DRAM/Sfk1 [Aphelenchus avenae]
MAIRVLWIIPVLSAICALIAFGVSYGVGVGRGDEAAWFSFISDGGQIAPERCIFSQFLNLAALFMGITMYLRHHQYVVFYRYKVNERMGWRYKFSVVMLSVGFAGCIGMSIVANFQEYSVPMAHGLAAWLAFFGGLIYCWGQVFLAYIQRPRMTHLCLNHFRLLLAVVCTAALTLRKSRRSVTKHGSCLDMTTLMARPFVKLVDGVKPTPEPFTFDGSKVMSYKPDSPFFVNHLVACIAEWVLGLGFEAFVLTFAWELAMFEMHPPQLRLIEKITFKTLRSSSPASVSKSAFGTLDSIGHGTTTTGGRLPRIRPAANGDFFTANPAAHSPYDDGAWGTIRTRDGNLNTLL